MDASSQQSPVEQPLKLSGYGYMLGDVALGAAALARSKDFSLGAMAQAVSGSALWLAGGMAAARYGNPAEAKQLELIGAKLGAHFRAQGITIPAEVEAQHTLLRRRNVVETLEDFLYQHPSELLNGFFAAGAAMFIHQGVRELHQGKSLLPWGSKAAQHGTANKLWMGLLVGTGALAGLLIHEDPEAREKAKDGSVIQKAMAYVQEKPLRLTSLLYGANNIFTANDAWEDFKQRGTHGNVKPYYFSTLAAASYVISNGLLHTAEREQITREGISPTNIAKLEEAAAQIIAMQPPAVQTALLQDTATYLAQEKGVGLQAEEIAKVLAERVSALTQRSLEQAAEQVSWAERQRAKAQTMHAAEAVR